ncbi:MAG: FkbM family methyltransferase [Rhodobacteraceae bacterium PARR1]|nr:MAG: FkbM family methyltransferase [Rhodobacteraceae bacterium PARR1]
MVIYRPETALQQVLHALRNVPGFVGLSARRKLARRYGKRAVADFDTRLRQIGPGDAVVDVGANVGLFTARLADTGAEVHAWEPDPYAFDRLTNRFSGVANVHLHNAAVAQRPGRLRLARKAAFNRDPGRYSTASSIYFAPEVGGDSIEVDVVAFDEALARCKAPVKLVKMDIEGAEFDILTSIFADPAACPAEALYVETHEMLDPAKIPLIDRLRAEAESLPRPVVNLYWP